jgi:hypothetical protein
VALTVDRKCQKKLANIAWLGGQMLSKHCTSSCNLYDAWICDDKLAQNVALSWLEGFQDFENFSLSCQILEG